MDSVNLNKKVKIKGISFSLKEIVLVIPSKYEHKIFLEESQAIIPNTFYKFIFYPGTSVCSKNKLIMNGTASGHQIKIIHSAKLNKFFLSQNCISFCGQFENNVCFFPEILKTITRTNEFCPVYKGFTNYITKNITEALVGCPEELKTCLQEIHFPTSIEKVNFALRQLLLFELSIFFETIFKLKKPREPYKLYEIQSPFALTEDQHNVWQEIQQDFVKTKRFIRVLHGDVGSGKTLIAYLTAMLAVKNGKKVAIMAPTGILANQIYNFFIQHNYDNVSIGLIVAETSRKKIKLEILQQYDIFIGTHALLYKDYVQNLGLLIIDEQHRFGVNQRNSLLKDNVADILMLTATAIPRTYQMMGKGYIEFSQLKIIPTSGKRTTMVISKNKLNEVFVKMFHLSQTNKIIWICHTIEIANERFAYFKANADNVFLIHGKMKDKNDILHDFDLLPHGVLVSTTVIEVGIDIDINFIFIEDADHFGLAQLHQMRGRVGRRSRDGYCILIGSNLVKLRQVKSAEDGFAITNLDLNKRGGGIVHGLQQSGFSSFKFAKTIENYRVIDCDITEEIMVEAQNITMSPETTKIIGDFEDTEVKI